MNRIILTIFLGLLPLEIILAGSWETPGFRTANGQLVERGMTKTEVRRDAGKPMDRNSAARINGKKSSTSKKRKGGEVWTYKGNDGYYAITFISGRVATIEVTPFRGY